jgi:hypothetical protein
VQRCKGVSRNSRKNYPKLLDFGVQLLQTSSPPTPL